MNKINIILLATFIFLAPIKMVHSDTGESETQCDDIVNAAISAGKGIDGQVNDSVNSVESEKK